MTANANTRIDHVLIDADHIDKLTVQYHMKNDLDIESTHCGLSIKLITNTDVNYPLIIPNKYKSKINSRKLTNPDNLNKFQQELNNKVLNYDTT